MKVIAFNGSPRKNWNTATLLENALVGAASQGAETELIHLYDYQYQGCTSCFGCKLIGGTGYGKCNMQDELTPVLEKFLEADAVFLGSPIYFGNVTGELRSFMERLFFPYYIYTKEKKRTLFPKKIKVGFIYTMNLPEETIKKIGYEQQLATYEKFVKVIFGEAEAYYCTDTLQFSDYSRYVSDIFDPEAKAGRHQEVFPQDCQEVFAMGARFAQSIGGHTD